MLWTECLDSPPDLYVKALLPKVMVFGGGVFGRLLGNEGEALMNGVSAIIRRDTREPPLSPLSALPCKEARRWPSGEEEGSRQNPNMLAHLISAFLGFRIVRNKFCHLSHPVYGNL